MGAALSDVKERKMSFYVRSENGAYIPVEFEKVRTDSWDNSFVVVKVKNEHRDITEQDLDVVYEALQGAEILDELENTSFFITGDEMEFSRLAETEEIKRRLLEGEELADILEGAK
jgi:hypothetical protein